jgi:hypothetical protein
VLAFGAYLYLLVPGKEYQRVLYVLLAIAFYAGVAFAARIPAKPSWARAVHRGS